MTLRTDRGTRFLTFLCSCVLAACIHACAATPKVTTVAGGSLGNWKSATSASFGLPLGVILDSKGNLYVSDSVNCRIRKITVKGTVSTFAGNGICGYGGDGGPATSAMLSTPFSLAFDSAGNLLIADSGNARIRKVSVARTITTFAGNGVNGYSGDGGPATLASLYDPSGVSVDPSGNVYIGDTLNHVIRMVDQAGNIHTVAGSHKSGFSGDGGPATSAELSYPEGAISDGNGNLFIADTDNERVRKVDASGIITTYAGNDSGLTGNGGPAASAGIGPSYGLLLGQSKLYISTFSGIWSVDSATQVITFIAGSLQGATGFNGDSQVALSTLFAAPQAIAMDKAGNLLVADEDNGRIRKIGVDQIVSTVAGGYIGDGGPAIQASLSLGFWDHACFDSAGNLYIADYYNNRLRRVSTTGIITTIAGNGMTGPPQDNVQATTTSIKPDAVAVGPSGDVFIADSNSGRIRKVDSSGTITTFSNVFTGFSGSLATDTIGNIYASDGFSVVWKITPSGSATIVAGESSQIGYNGDGIAATSALLNQPTGLAVDSTGNIYICDSGNNRIRKVDISGIISTVAGNGTAGFSGDGGLATAAMVFEPSDVAVDAKGNLYIADRINERVRVVDSSGTIRTLAGSGNFGYNGNWLPALSTNMYPSGVTVSPAGVVYVVDEASGRVRKIR